MFGQMAWRRPGSPAGHLPPRCDQLSASSHFQALFIGLSLACLQQVGGGDGGFLSGPALGKGLGLSPTVGHRRPSVDLNSGGSAVRESPLLAFAQHLHMQLKRLKYFNPRLCLWNGMAFILQTVQAAEGQAGAMLTARPRSRAGLKLGLPGSQQQQQQRVCLFVCLFP